MDLKLILAIEKGLLNDKDEKNWWGYQVYFYTNFLFLYSGQCRSKVSGEKRRKGRSVIDIFNYKCRSTGQAGQEILMTDNYVNQQAIKQLNDKYMAKVFKNSSCEVLYLQT